MENKTLTCLNCYVKNSTESKLCYFCDCNRLIETDRLTIKVELDELIFDAKIGPCEEDIFKFAYKVKDIPLKTHEQIRKKYLGEKKVIVVVNTYDDLCLLFVGVILSFPDYDCSIGYSKVEIVPIGDIQITQEVKFESEDLLNA